MAHITKCQDVEDDVWEVPKAKNWRVKRRTAGQDAASRNLDCSSGAITRPKRVVEGLTVEKLAAEFGKMRRRFKSSECAKGVGRVLKRRDWRGRVDKAVCIGIGSLSTDWENRWRSMWQLVLFEWVVGQVSNEEQGIRLFAQEPAFLPLDIAFLSTLGITVLESGIEDHISPSTFVFAPFVDWNLLLPTFLADRDPELYIGNEILGDYTRFANSEEKKGKVEECNEIGEKWREERQWVWVPEFEGGGGLEGLGVGWKEEPEEDDE
ncbi:hypothetical protein P154DRAFT_66528 [Amniculicola lignicola CBS 123094]|uniref:SRR1-like domain-containing protein n=1 Tax=Amniculicola lignicola CBS 123094 TaxID=1392246 RepID=A0A6A5X1I6_9PLEO|nr:hypothetical protein P154DRAFT_66528 [Amniculicola lignicola CBS 123094]